MRRVRSDLTLGQRRPLFAAALLTFFIAASPVTAQTGNMNDLAERSKTMLPPTLDFERRATEAFTAKSLMDLEGLYSELKAQIEVTEASLEKGINASGCDVAVANLLIIIGFAMNRLGKDGRYEPWMADESLRLLAEYQSSMTDCATDAKAPPARPYLTAQHLKAL